MVAMFFVVVLAFFAWINLYLALIFLNPQHKAEWHCRIVTFCHALLIVTLSGWSVFVEGPWPFTEPAGPNTSLQEYTCAVSFGYFIFDFFWCVYFQTEGPLMLFHHLLSMFGCSLVLLRGYNGGEMMAALFGTELTNPILQIRWFLRYTSVAIPNYVKTVVDFAFLTLFTFMRIGVASILLLTYLQHPRPDIIARGGAVAIYTVGWIFWFAIVRYAWRKYVLGKSRSSEDFSKSRVNTECLKSNVPESSFQMGDNYIIGQSKKKDTLSPSSCNDMETEMHVRHRTGLNEGVLTDG